MAPLSPLGCAVIVCAGTSEVTAGAQRVKQQEMSISWHTVSASRAA